MTVQSIKIYIVKTYDTKQGQKTYSVWVLSLLLFHTDHWIHTLQLSCKSPCRFYLVNIFYYSLSSLCSSPLACGHISSSGSCMWRCAATGFGVGVFFLFRCCCQSLLGQKSGQVTTRWGRGEETHTYTHAHMQTAYMCFSKHVGLGPRGSKIKQLFH